MLSLTVMYFLLMIGIVYKKFTLSFLSCWQTLNRILVVIQSLENLDSPFIPKGKFQLTKPHHQYLRSPACAFSHPSITQLPSFHYHLPPNTMLAFYCMYQFCFELYINVIIQYELFCVVSLTLHYVCEVSPCSCIQLQFILFSLLMPYSMNIPQFILLLLMNICIIFSPIDFYFILSSSVFYCWQFYL